MSDERKKVWVDPFQTKLSMRIGGYLVVFFVVVLNFLFAWKMIAEGPLDPAQQFLDTLRDNMPAIISLLVLVPVMVWDMICFSHRLVGPLVRFRKTMQAIAEGEAVRPLKLREGDYLTEMRDDFNRMLEVLQKQGVAVLKPANPGQEKEVQKRPA